MAATETDPDPGAEELWLACRACDARLLPTQRAGTCVWRCPECDTQRVNVGTPGVGIR